MTENIILHDAAGTEYETAALLVTRPDETCIFRLVPTPETQERNLNIVVIPPKDFPRLRSDELKQCRSHLSIFTQNSSSVVLYPQWLVTDEYDEVFGYLGWIPDANVSLVPISEYASSPVRMLTAAKALASLFSCMGDSRLRLSTVDPDGFYMNADGSGIIYMSADLPQEFLIQREDHIHYIPPELLVLNRCAIDNDATVTAADYVLSVLLYRLLLETNPFCGDDPADLICSGISVFYDDSTPEYHRCMQQLHSLDPDLIRLFRLAFDYSCRFTYDNGRPTAYDWLDALTKDSRERV